METFEQGAVATGCMNCHNETRTQTDFLWSLLARAHPSILDIPGAPPPSPGLLGVAASSDVKARASAILPASQLRVFEALQELLRTKGN